MTQQQRLKSAGSLLAALLLTAAAMPASAQGNIQISGTGVAVDPRTHDTCQGPPQGYGDYDYFAVELTGDLEGCLYARLGEYKFGPSGAYDERGDEVIVACLNDGPCGLLFTSYHFTGKYALDFSQQFFGRCQHPIVWAEGGFAGATGRLDFKDNIVDGVAVDFDYRGHIKLQ